MAHSITKIEPIMAFGGPKARYAFGLYRTTGSVQRLVETADAPSFLELQLNPQSIDIVEPAATEFQPTLGGIMVESRGNLFKDCTISGTVGFMPKRGMSDGIADAFVSAFPDAMAKKSGYVEFLKLRNMFRRYASIKKGEATNTDADDVKSAAFRTSVRLCFLNYKDNEFWFAEPTAFQMPPRKGLTYNYSIRLRLLDPMSALDVPPRIDTRSWSKQMLDWSRSLRNSAAQIRASVTQGVAYLVGYVTDGLDTVANALDAVVTLGTLPATLTTQSVRALYDGVGQVLGVALDITAIPYQTTKAVIEARQTLAAIGTDAELFGRKAAANYQAFLDLYNGTSDAAPPPASAGSGASSMVVNAATTIFDVALQATGDANRYLEVIALNNLSPPYISLDPATRRPGTLCPGDTVLIPVAGGRADNTVSMEQTADPMLRGTMVVEERYGDNWLLHTSERWLPNQWVGFSVHITEAGGDVHMSRVVASDEHTLSVAAQDVQFPISWVVRLPSANSAQRDNALAFGVDLARQTSRDLVLSASGDLVLVTGDDNFNQAMAIKLETEAGSLPLHPWFGLSVAPGSKGTLKSVMEATMYATRSLRSDARVSDVVDVSAALDGDVLKLTASVVPKSTNTARVYTRTI